MSVTSFYACTLALWDAPAPQTCYMHEGLTIWRHINVILPPPKFSFKIIGMQMQMAWQLGSQASHMMYRGVAGGDFVFVFIDAVCIYITLRVCLYTVAQLQQGPCIALD